MPRLAAALLAIGVLLAGTLFFLIRRPEGVAEQSGWFALGSAALVLFPAVAAIASVSASIAFPLEEPGRRVWRSIGLAAAMWAAGRAIFWYYQIVYHQRLPFPSPADAFTLGCFLLFAWALAREIRVAQGVLTRAQAVALIAVGVVSLAAGYLVFLEPVAQNGLGTFGEWLSMTYGVVGVALLPLCLVPAVAYFGGLEGHVWSVVAAAMVCIVAAILWFANAIFLESWSVAHPSTLLQAIGFSLLAAGALWQRHVQASL